MMGALVTTLPILHAEDVAEILENRIRLIKKPWAEPKTEPSIITPGNFPVNSGQPTFSKFLSDAEHLDGMWQASPAWGLPVDRCEETNVNNGEKAWPPHRGKIPSPSMGRLSRYSLGYLKLLARRHTSAPPPVVSFDDVLPNGDPFEGRAVLVYGTGSSGYKSERKPLKIDKTLKHEWDKKLREAGLGKIELQPGSFAVCEEPVDDFGNIDGTVDQNTGEFVDALVADPLEVRDITGRIDPKFERATTEGVPVPRSKYAAVSVQINVRDEERTPEFEQWLRKHPHFGLAVSAHDCTYYAGVQAEWAKRLKVDGGQLSRYISSGQMANSPVAPLDTETAQRIAGKYFTFVAMNGRFELHILTSATETWANAAQAYLALREKRIAVAVNRAKRQLAKRKVSAATVERYIREVRAPFEWAWNSAYFIRMREGAWPVVKEIIVGPKGDFAEWRPIVPKMYDVIRAWMAGGNPPKVSQPTESAALVDAD